MGEIQQVQVSVVIPVYNVAPYLRQCLDSVAGQTLREIEIICVDDGSTDESPAILAEYAKKDSRFHVIHQVNQGPGSARNAGMDHASGEYLIFLDSDDWFESDFLERMAARAKETGADVTICRAVEFDTCTNRELPSDWMLKTACLPGGLVFAPGDAAEHLFQFTYGWPWDKLYRRDYLLKEGFRYPNLAVSQDLVFVYPSIFCAERIAALDRVLIHHRVNRLASVSNSRSKTPEDSHQALKLVEAYLEERGLMEVYRKSFLNWAMEFLVWHVCSIGDRAVRRRYYRVLRQSWLPELHFDRYPKGYFTNRTVFAKYRLARYAPYPIFSAILRFCKAVKSRRTA